MKDRLLIDEELANILKKAKNSPLICAQLAARKQREVTIDAVCTILTDAGHLDCSELIHKIMVSNQ